MSATFNYSKLAATAIVLLRKFGADMTITALDGTTRIAKAVRVKDIKHTYEVSEIQVGDVLYFVAPQTTTGADAAPLENERVEHGGDSLVIVQKEPVKPAAIVMGYFVYARIG